MTGWAPETGADGARSAGFFGVQLAKQSVAARKGSNARPAAFMAASLAAAMMEDKEACMHGDDVSGHRLRTQLVANESAKLLRVENDPKVQQSWSCGFYEFARGGSIGPKKPTMLTP